MIPSNLATLFWDTNVENFTPEAYPDYTILRVLEYGDETAIKWLRGIFPESEIRRVLTGDSRLSRKSATFWALVYGIPQHAVAALVSSR